jgi:hypothetical protein
MATRRLAGFVVLWFLNLPEKLEVFTVLEASCCSVLPIGSHLNSTR